MTGVVNSEPQSPFTTLNEKFIRQNSEFEDITSRLRNRLNKLSDTNYPVPPLSDNIKEGKNDTPFNQGYLMDYYSQLERQSRLINELLEQINKLEALT